MQYTTLNSLTELKAWLTKNEIDFAGWGQAATKTLVNLWDEIQGGETVLVDVPPLRISQVVQVIVRQGDLILIEAEQLFQNQQRRPRNMPPSEKFKPNEDHIQAAIRCLQEELGVTQQAISVVTAWKEPHIQETSSGSYPGLRSRYVVYTVEAAVTGLPTTDFCTEEAASNTTDPISKHYWTWQHADMVNLAGFTNSTKNRKA